MSELRKKTYFYSQSMMFFTCMVIVAMEFILSTGVIKFDRLFFWCYMLMFFMMRLIFVIYDKDKYSIIIELLSAVLLIVIFRDIVLSINILAALLFSVIFYFFRFDKIDRFGWTILSVLMLVLWLTSGKPGKVVVVALLVSALYALIKITDSMSEYPAFIILFIGIIALFLPTRDDPIRWSLIRKSITLAIESSHKMRDETEYFIEGFSSFNVGRKGYSGNGKLLGGINGKSKEELMLEGIGKSRGKYLTGSVFKKISPEGLSNKATQDELDNKWFVEFINALYSAGVNKSEASCFSKMENMQISYRYLHTEDIIFPEKLLYTDIDERDKNKKHRKGFSYIAHYMAVDYGSPYFLAVVAKGGGEYESYDTIQKYVKELYNVDIKTFMSEKEYNDAVSYFSGDRAWLNDYLDKTMLTPRIEELTAEVVKDSHSDYEKAKKIESFLRGYEYSTSVDLRNKDNYVESFLFDAGEGYCVHYASAMVVMLRACGIPSRYVNGYLRPEAGDGIIEHIMGSSAHSWAEAYISGIGWVRMEPTKIMERAEGATWGLEAKDMEDSIIKSSQELYIPDGYYYDEYYRQHFPANYEEASSGNAENRADRDKQVKKKFYRELIIKFGRYILIMIGFILTIILVYKLARLYIYMRMKPEDKLKENMKHMFRKLDKLLPEGESVDSIKDYLKVITDDNLRTELDEVFDDYYRVRFRGDVPSDELIRRTRKMI